MLTWQGDRNSFSGHFSATSKNTFLDFCYMFCDDIYIIYLSLSRVGSGENMGRFEGEACVTSGTKCTPWEVNISATSKNTFLDFSYMLFDDIHIIYVSSNRVESGESRGRFEDEAWGTTGTKCPPWEVNISATSKNTFLDFCYMFCDDIHIIYLSLSRVGSGESRGRLEGEACVTTGTKCPPWEVNISATSKNTFLDFWYLLCDDICIVYVSLFRVGSGENMGRWEGEACGTTSSAKVTFFSHESICWKTAACMNTHIRSEVPFDRTKMTKNMTLLSATLVTT